MLLLCLETCEGVNGVPMELVAGKVGEPEVVGEVVGVPSRQHDLVSSHMRADIEQALRHVGFGQEVAVRPNHVDHLAVQRHEDGGHP
jgi:hypothetical protein